MVVVNTDKSPTAVPGVRVCVFICMLTQETACQTLTSDSLSDDRQPFLHYTYRPNSLPKQVSRRRQLPLSHRPGYWCAARMTRRWRTLPEHIFQLLHFVSRVSRTCDFLRNQESFSVRQGSSIHLQLPWMVSVTVLTARHKTTSLIRCGNYMVCHKNVLYNKTLHQQHMFLLFQITIHSHKQLPPIPSKRSSILSQPHRPHIPVCSHCVQCLSARLLNVCPNGRWNEWLRVSCSLTAGNPKSVASV